MWDSIGAVRGGGVSESVAKAPRAGISREKKRGISTFLFRRFVAIGAFATDLDKRRRRGPLRGRRPRRSPRRSGRPAPPRPEHSTLPVGLSTVKNAYGTICAQTMASTMIAALPLTILFMLFQRQIIKAVATTGLGGQ